MIKMVKMINTKNVSKAPPVKGYLYEDAPFPDAQLGKERVENVMMDNDDGHTEV